MINYIKSEMYRNLRNKSNYMFLGGCMVLIVFLNLVLHMILKNDPNFIYATTKFSFSSLYTSMTLPLILCVPLTSTVFGQELKNHTLKNTISYGIPRWQIYFGKFIMVLIIALINLVVVSGTHIACGYLLLQNSGDLYLNELIRALIACIPLFLVAVSAAHCLYFIFDNENTAIVYWAIIMVVIPTILSMLGRRVEILNKIASFTPWIMMRDIRESEGAHNLIMYWCSQEGFINCFIVGLIGTIIFLIIGMKRFEKIEIK